MTEAGTAALTNNAAAEAAPPPQRAVVTLNPNIPIIPAEHNHPEAVAARARIAELKGDKEFYAKLKAEGERGVSGPARQEWDRLHRVGHPSPTAIGSQADVDAQGASRSAEQMNSYIAMIKQSAPLNAEQEAEIRSGVINAEVYAWAQEEKQRLIKDREFYKKLLNGDRAANRDWNRVITILSLRPVKDYRPPGRS